MLAPQSKKKVDHDHRQRKRTIALWLGISVLGWSAIAELVAVKLSITPIIFAILYGLGAYVCFGFKKWTLPTFLLSSISAMVVLEVILYFLFVPLTSANLTTLITNLGFLPLLQVLFIAYRYRTVYGEHEIFGERLPRER